MTRYDKFKQEALADYIENEKFTRVKDLVLANMERRRGLGQTDVYGDGGFGVLAEKSLHAVLKYFNEPDDDFHEVALGGFFADICKDGVITEIQTKRLANLKRKLAYFLETHKVNVVHPVAVNKWRGYTESEAIRPDSFRLSGHHLNEYSAFSELYGIKEFLKHPGLSVHLYMMDIEEILVKQGRVHRRRKARSGYERFEDIPLGIRRIIKLECPNDYMQFIPDIEGEFTSADFAGAAGIARETASLVLSLLTHIGVVERVGKQGRAYLYEVAY